MHLDCGNEIHQYACSFENKDDVDFQVVHFSDDYNNNTITDHSYSSLTIKDTYLKHGQVSINLLPIKNIKVKVRTLNTILSELNIDHVDFLSVDTEGWELEVMKGFDVSKYTPKVILLENWIHTPTYTEYMKSIGYKLNQKLQYNYIFTK
jgi:FkbM family methyltransferase